jgi:hypothetical protein
MGRFPRALLLWLAATAAAVLATGSLCGTLSPWFIAGGGAFYGALFSPVLVLPFI